MQILAYNQIDNSFFLGLSLIEFEEISQKFKVDYGYNSNYEKEKQNAIRNNLRLDYIKMIKEFYDIENPPFICIVVDCELSVKIVDSHYPFSPLWNGYSPWKNIQIHEIKDLIELKKFAETT